jgi:hypothetical protein
VDLQNSIDMVLLHALAHLCKPLTSQLYGCTAMGGEHASTLTALLIEEALEDSRADEESDQAMSHSLTSRCCGRKE